MENKYKSGATEERFLPLLGGYFTFLKKFSHNEATISESLYISYVMA
jgi:hypothetical protein